MAGGSAWLLTHVARGAVLITGAHMDARRSREARLIHSKQSLLWYPDVADSGDDLDSAGGSCGRHEVTNAREPPDPAFDSGGAA